MRTNLTIHKNQSCDESLPLGGTKKYEKDKKKKEKSNN